jgi:hypothetical protein
METFHLYSTKKKPKKGEGLLLELSSKKPTNDDHTSSQCCNINADDKMSSPQIVVEPPVTNCSCLLFLPYLLISWFNQRLLPDEIRTRLGIDSWRFQLLVKRILPSHCPCQFFPELSLLFCLLHLVLNNNNK